MPAADIFAIVGRREWRYLGQLVNFSRTRIGGCEFRLESRGPRLAHRLEWKTGHFPVGPGRRETRQGCGMWQINIVEREGANDAGQCISAPNAAHLTGKSIKCAASAAKHGPKMENGQRHQRRCSERKLIISARVPPRELAEQVSPLRVTGNLERGCWSNRVAYHLATPVVDVIIWK